MFEMVSFKHRATVPTFVVPLMYPSDCAKVNSSCLPVLPKQPY